MNIYNLAKSFIEIFDELEENGGELTEELEQKLAITQESFTTSVKNMSSVIKQLNNDCDSIKLEQKRLKELYDRKQKVINRLEKILVDAINQFGDTKKTGVKYVGWETGEASIRKSQVVDVNVHLVDEVTYQLNTMAKFNKDSNQLDVCNHISLDSIVEDYNHTNEPANHSDLENINVDLAITVPLKALEDGSGYPVIREIVKYNDDYKITASVSKTELKNKLKDNGSCMPHLAKLVTNENLQIK